MSLTSVYAVQDGCAAELVAGLSGTYSARWEDYGTVWIVVSASSSNAAVVASHEYDRGRKLTDDEIIALGLSVHGNDGIVHDVAHAHMLLDELEIEVPS